MLIEALFPVLIAIVGVLMFVFSGNPKRQEIGKIMFAAGMFALAFALAGHSVTVGTPTR